MLALELGYEQRERLAVTSLLHDIGKLVLAFAYPGYPGAVHGDAATPVERVRREREELGISTSTVRSHLHGTYRKLGAADRAQAVLIASENGWI